MIDGVAVEAFVLSSSDWQTPFSLLFEETQARIDSTEGGYCEGDGAFGWHAATFPETACCGTIHCIDERIMCFEFHARLKLDAWNYLREVLQLDDRTAFQFPELGVMIGPKCFQRVIEAATTN